MTGSYGFRDRPSRQDLFLSQNESADLSPVLLTRKNQERGSPLEQARKATLRSNFNDK
jgi:hypothetical protein